MEAEFTITWTEDTTYTAATAKLVDANGAEQVWVNGSLVPAKNDSGHSYAIIKVQITGVTLSHKDDNNTVTEQEKAGAAGIYTLYLAVDGTAKSRVHVFGTTEAPNADGEFDDDYDTQITVSVQLDKDGNIVSNSNSEVTIYYTFGGAQTTNDEDHADSTTNGLDITWSLVGTAPTVKNHAN